MKHYSKAEKHSYFKGFFKGLDKGRNKNCSRVDYSGIDALIHRKASEYCSHMASKYRGCPDVDKLTDVAKTEKEMKKDSDFADYILTQYK